MCFFIHLRFLVCVHFHHGGTRMQGGSSGENGLLEYINAYELISLYNIASHTPLGRPPGLVSGCVVLRRSTMEVFRPDYLSLVRDWQMYSLGGVPGALLPHFRGCWFHRMGVRRMSSGVKVLHECLWTYVHNIASHIPLGRPQGQHKRMCCATTSDDELTLARSGKYTASGLIL